MRTEFAAGVLADVTQTGDVFVVEDRLRDFQPHRRVDVVGVEQVWLGSNEGHQRHHHRFADRIDRRVGHLRKQLLEVIVERLVLVGHDSQRRVIAHGTGRLFTLYGHWRHQEFQVFLRIAKGLLTVEQAGFRCCDFSFALHVAELDAYGFNPLLVRLGVGERVLEFFVVDDATCFQIDQEHLARLQAPFVDDLRFWNRQHAGFGCHHNEVVVGHDVTRRTQAVAVERTADVATVGKRHGGWAVPWLHHRGVIFIEGATIVIHRRMVFPCFRNHHHHRLRNRIAGHHQQFERIVEAGGIGLAFINQREQFFQIIAKHSRLHHAFARAHPVEIALDGVDLAIVREQTIRVRQRPLREGIGRKTLVHQRQRRHA